MKFLAIKLWNWLTFPTRLAHYAGVNLGLAESYAESYRLTLERLRGKEKVISELEAQLVQTRVSQSRIGRAGWEVMCFIPEEVLNQFGPDRNAKNNPAFFKLIEEIVTKQVTRALAGINRVDAQGKVCALVFEPLDMRRPARSPRFVQALFDKEGEFKMSEKCWDSRSEEQRVRSAAGCGGYGV